MRRHQYLAPNNPTPSGSGHHKRWRDYDAPRPSKRNFKRRNLAGGDVTRNWTFSSRDLSSFQSRFVVVSYNILGVGNASNHPDLYRSVCRKHLDWGERKRKICNELSIYKPSVLCFQEVDRFDDMANHLQKDGYAGVYKGRTEDATDGCAIFWKEEQFSLLHHEDIEYQKFGLRNNVAQLCVLKLSHNQSNASICEDANSQIEESTSSETVVVGNIHVLFNPKRGDIKLGQIRLLLERAHSISQKWGNIPVVICGDLNSIPQSALYQFVTSSEMDILMYDRKNISGQLGCRFKQMPFSIRSNDSRSLFGIPEQLKYEWSEEEITLAAGKRGCTCLKNPLQLFSAYQGVPGGPNTRDYSGEPLVTTYHSEFMGTVDYIWHSSSLLPVGVVETLPIKSLKRWRGLPSKQWGSDHLALICEFAFVDNSKPG